MILVLLVLVVVPLVVIVVGALWFRLGLSC